MYKWTKTAPKKVGFYWVNDFCKDGVTSRKGFPKVVQVELDTRYECSGQRVPKGTLIAKELWSSWTSKRTANLSRLQWAGRIEEPTVK
jgi:hypothetical protein